MEDYTRKQAKALTLTSMLLACGQPREKVKLAIDHLAKGFGVDHTIVDEALIQRVCRWHDFYLAFLKSSDCYAPLSENNVLLVRTFGTDLAEIALVLHQFPQWIEWALKKDEKDKLMAEKMEKFAYSKMEEREFISQFDSLEEPSKTVALWVWNEPVRKQLRSKMRQAGN